MGAVASSNSLAGRSLGDLVFIEVLIAIILAWILVALFQRVIENFAYNTLGLNQNSAFDALVVALVALAVFLTFTFIIDSFIGGIIEEEIEGGFQAPEAPN